MELLNKIQKELKVPKGQFNAFSKYHYRNAEDILEAVKPLLGDGVLILEDEVVCVGDRHYVKATAELSWPRPPKEGEDIKGSYFGRATATAYAREALEKKGMDEAQITGAASSYARKYALCGLFCIDDGADADADDNSQKTYDPVTASYKKPVPPKQVANSRDALKKRIKELVDDKTLVEMTSGEDYKSYVLEVTGFDLVPEHFEEIITKLEAIQ